MNMDQNEWQYKALNFISKTTNQIQNTVSINCISNKGDCVSQYETVYKKSSDFLVLHDCI